MVGQHVSLFGGLFGADEAQNVVSHARIAAPVAADVDDEVRGPAPPDLVEGLVEYLVAPVVLPRVLFRRYSEFRYAIRSDICCAVNRGQASFFWFMRSNMRGPWSQR